MGQDVPFFKHYVGIGLWHWWCCIHCYTVINVCMHVSVMQLKQIQPAAKIIGAIH